MSVMGERAEMSCALVSGVPSTVSDGQHTNDLLYESKLSREILKGSVSASKLRWFEDVVEVVDLECQNVGFSCVGEGLRTSAPAAH
jgi:hypothetical protein